MTFEDFSKIYKKNQIVWICDYRYNNKIIEKPIRHIPPTKVAVYFNDDLPKNKRIYYSNIHFKKLNRENKPLKSSIISPYDNTGFRFKSGIAVQVFLTEKEAIEYYMDRCHYLSIKASEEKYSINIQYDSIISSFLSKKDEYENKYKELK